MKRISLIFAALFVLAALPACDEGDIGVVSQQPESGNDRSQVQRVAKLTANISGAGSWSSQYALVLAGFAPDNDYAVVLKHLPEQVEGDITTTLIMDDESIESVELCVTNRLRQRVVSFASVPMTLSEGDTILLDAGHVDAGMYQAIQTLVFNTTCARCHGLGNKPAAGLTLAEGQSYAALVNQPSAVPERGMRVLPGDATNSLLHRVIHGDASAGVHYDHSNMIKETRTMNLIDHWINDGALP